MEKDVEALKLGGLVADQVIEEVEEDGGQMFDETITPIPEEQDQDINEADEEAVE